MIRDVRTWRDGLGVWHAAVMVCGPPPTEPAAEEAALAAIRGEVAREGSRVDLGTVAVRREAWMVGDGCPVYVYAESYTEPQDAPPAEDVPSPDDDAPRPPTSRYGCGDDGCEACYGNRAWREGIDPSHTSAFCRHCGRTIYRTYSGGWVDPEASGDDEVWRETCDSHDTFTAEHEPEGDA